MGTYDYYNLNSGVLLLDYFKKIFLSPFAIAIYLIVILFLVFAAVSNSKLPIVIAEDNSFKFNGETFKKSEYPNWISREPGIEVARISKRGFSLKTIFFPNFVYAVGSEENPRFILCRFPGKSTVSLFVNERVTLTSPEETDFSSGTLYIATSKDNILSYTTHDTRFISEMLELSLKAESKNDTDNTQTLPFGDSSTEFAFHLNSNEFPELYYFSGVLKKLDSGTLGILCPNLSYEKLVFMPVTEYIQNQINLITESPTLPEGWTKEN